MSDITEFTNREPKIWDVTKVADVMDHLKRGEKNVIFSEARAVCKLAIRGAERIEEMMSRGIVSGDFATGYNRLLKDALPRRTDQRKLKIICHSEKVFGYWAGKLDEKPSPKEIRDAKILVRAAERRYR